MKKPTKKTNSPTTRLVSVWLPAEIARELDKTAKARDLTKSQIIRRAIKNEIKQPA
jgi:predicted transcriptional regulator